METTELNKIIELTDKIQREIFKDNQRTVTFVWDEKTNGVKVFTYNPHIRESFLLIDCPLATTKEAALEGVYSYLRSHVKDNHSYTVLWHKKTGGTGQAEKSYFRASNLIELAEKFYASPSGSDHQKDPNEYIILGLFRS